LTDRATPVASGYKITTVTVSGIATACNTKNIRLALANEAGDPLFSTGPTGIDAITFTYDATGDNIDIATNLGKVTVIIG